MQTLAKLLLVLGAVLNTHFAAAATTKARLLLGSDSARPGDTVLAGVQFQMEKKWHIYWRNSGESGIPTEIEWHLPAGISNGETLWPVPEKSTAVEQITYDYHHEVVLLVPLTLAVDAPPGPLKLGAKVTWLECDVGGLCVRGSQEIQAVLVVGGENRASTHAGLLAGWQAKLPLDGKELNASVDWDGAAVDDRRAALFSWTAGSQPAAADFFAYPSEAFQVDPRTELLPFAAGRAHLRVKVIRMGAVWPTMLNGLIITERTGDEKAYAITAPIAAGAAGATAPAPIAVGSLLSMLLYAFIGGLILNIMPCVLPVIALKILGFVGQSKEAPGRVRTLGLIYAAGVLVSFLALAALVIGVKAAGHRAGWGMQFSNPQFIVVLTVLVTLVALNLFGLFEINLSGRVMGAAGEAAAGHGAAGAFFNGVLATILATPCTAPFLGAALGFAFAQPAAIILLILLTVGAGLAAPYVVLSWNPAWLKFLPKPGAWMEKFKIAMGFPMLATAVWIMSLVPTFYGKRTWWLGVFLVLVALAAWIYGDFVQRGSKRRGLAAALAALVLVAGFVFTIEGKLRWRTPMPPEASGGSLANEKDGVPWQPWSPDAVARARSEGRPVLVDFTADWCVTCNTIVKPALESSSVRTKLKEINAVALLGNYTRFPPAITEELERYGRAGVPLVLVFPRDASRPAMVLPEALTPGMVVKALIAAAP